MTSGTDRALGQNLTAEDGMYEGHECEEFVSPCCGAPINYEFCSSCREACGLGECIECGKEKKSWPLTN